MRFALIRLVENLGMEEGIGSKMQEGKNIESGFINNKRWIRGKVSIGKNRYVYVDTLSGEGVADILEALNKFITYQAAKVNFNSYSNEDVAQEIRLLALEAIPKYDDTKKTNMLTFLQNHIRNRIINLCKFVSEKRRRASFYKNDMVKVRCPGCSRFSVQSSTKTHLECARCGHESESSLWKKYNLPVYAIPSGSITSNNNDSTSEMCLLDLISDQDDDMPFLREEGISLDKVSQLRMDFKSIFDSLDDVNKSIIRMVIEGHTYKEIAKEVGLSEKAAYARANKIMQQENVL